MEYKGRVIPMGKGASEVRAYWEARKAERKAQYVMGIILILTFVALAILGILKY